MLHVCSVMMARTHHAVSEVVSQKMDRGDATSSRRGRWERTLRASEDVTKCVLCGGRGRKASATIALGVRVRRETPCCRIARTAPGCACSERRCSQMARASRAEWTGAVAALPPSCSRRHWLGRLTVSAGCRNLSSKLCRQTPSQRHEAAFGSGSDWRWAVRVRKCCRPRALTVAYQQRPPR